MVDAIIEFFWFESSIDRGSDFSGVKSVGERIPAKIYVGFATLQIIECLLVRAILRVLGSALGEAREGQEKQNRHKPKTEEKLAWAELFGHYVSEAEEQDQNTCRICKQQ